MNTKKFLIASALITSGLLASCDLAETKKLSVDELCDGICNLTLAEQQELQNQIIDKKHADDLKTGAKVSSD